MIINNFDDIKPIFEELNNRIIDSKNDLENFIKNVSDLSSELSENLAWRYIRMTINTEDKKLADSYSFFVSEISPKIEPYENKFNHKIYESKYFNELDEKKFFNYKRQLENEIEIFREENIKLNSELSILSQNYSEIIGKQSIDYNGENITMQNANQLLKDNDRNIRKLVFEKIATRRLEDKNKLDDIFDKMVMKRNQIAINAGFENYRDYIFVAKNRFDYNKNNCFEFHESVKNEFLPISKQILENRKLNLNYIKLYPYDTLVDEYNKPALKPFQNSEQLLDKTIKIFNKIDPYFGECILTMKKMKHLDLDSKKGKASGGYNYPLYKTGVPFIFMNSVGSQRDLITMVHEGGHAIHSFMTKNYDYMFQKSFPSEVAELASMSMELLTMDYWDEFYEDKNELIRAKKEHLADIITTMSWIAIVDKFQHKIYENPQLSIDERSNLWEEINKDFSTNVIDYSEYLEVQKSLWHKQLHIFEVPFYYIEYGFSQLGAISIWKNYKENPTKAIQDYKNALSLGYTQSIGDIYKKANIKFDFSNDYIKSLVNFVSNEYNKL